MSVMPIPLEAGRAECASPEHLPLVDAAAAKPGGPAGKEMRDTLCRVCPVAERCMTWAMTHPEIGIWAGTSPNARTRHGAPRRTLTPLYREPSAAPRVVRDDSERVSPTPNATTVRCAELGIRPGEVKQWAYERGMVRTIKGRVSMAHVQAWAAAHGRAEVPHT